MLTSILASLVLIALTTVIHYEALRLMYVRLPRLAIPNRTKVMAVIFGAFAAHALEIAVYGAALYLLVQYLGVGRLSGQLGFSFENCLYFSAETYTSLGFGDLTPTGSIRLLAGVEALNGLVLVGWTASFVYISMERFWLADSGDGRRAALSVDALDALDASVVHFFGVVHAPVPSAWQRAAVSSTVPFGRSRVPGFSATGLGAVVRPSVTAICGVTTLSRDASGVGRADSMSRVVGLVGAVAFAGDDAAEAATGGAGCAWAPLQTPSVRRMVRSAVFIRRLHKSFV